MVLLVVYSSVIILGVKYMKKQMKCKCIHFQNCYYFIMLAEGEHTNANHCMLRSVWKSLKVLSVQIHTSSISFGEKANDKLTKWNGHLCGKCEVKNHVVCMYSTPMLDTRF